MYSCTYVFLMINTTIIYIYIYAIHISYSETVAFMAPGRLPGVAQLLRRARQGVVVFVFGCAPVGPWNGGKSEVKQLEGRRMPLYGISNGDT